MPSCQKRTAAPAVALANGIDSVILVELAAMTARERGEAGEGVAGSEDVPKKVQKAIR